MKTSLRTVDMMPGLVYTEHGFGYEAPTHIRVAISTSNDRYYTMTNQVNSRHGRVFDLPNDDPILKEYRDINERWHKLMAQLGAMYNNA